MPQMLLGVFDGREVHLSIIEPGGRPPPSQGRPCRTAAEAPAAIADFLASNGSPPVAAAAFCAPGPEVNGAIEVMDADLRLDRAQLRAAVGAPRVHLINDFTACALAIPHLRPDEVAQLGGGPAAPDSPMVAIGSWEWLGVGVVAPDPGGELHPMSACGGHAVLAASTDTEAQILDWLRRDTGGPVRACQVISQPGIANVHRALVGLAQAPDALLADFAAVLAAAQRGDHFAKAAIDHVTCWQGSLAGDLALTVGARGGVYLFDPPMAAMPDIFDRDALRERFEAKGALAAYMRGVPLFLVATQEPRLLGLSALFID